MKREYESFIHIPPYLDCRLPDDGSVTFAGKRYDMTHPEFIFDDNIFNEAAETLISINEPDYDWHEKRQGEFVATKKASPKADPIAPETGVSDGATFGDRKGV